MSGMVVVVAVVVVGARIGGTEAPKHGARQQWLHLCLQRKPITIVISQGRTLLRTIMEHYEGK